MPLSAVSPVDFLVEGGGSIFLLRPVSEAGKVWAEEHIGRDNGFQPYWPHAIVVEHHYIPEIVAGIQRDGLVCA